MIFKLTKYSVRRKKYKLAISKLSYTKLYFIIQKLKLSKFNIFLHQKNI